MPLAPEVAHARVERLAIVGAEAHWRAENLIAAAARRLGIDARVYDALGDGRRLKGLAGPLLERRIMRFDPDFVICTRHAWRMGWDHLERVLRRRRSALWFFDPIDHEGVAELGRMCDVMYTTYAGQRELWRQRGIPVVRFLPQGLDPDVERPATKLRPIDVCEASFVGSGPWPHRWPLLAAVAAVCDLQIRGPGWRAAPSSLPVRGGRTVGERYAQVVGAAAVALGANSVPEMDVDAASASDRMWKILGCGGAYVGPWVPGIDAMARDREHCRWYRNSDECAAIVLELLAHPVERRAMALRGHQHAMAHHTYDARLKVLFSDGEMQIGPGEHSAARVTPPDQIST